MIVQCADCKARYQLQAEKVPPRVIRVRCPRCRAVFSLDGRNAAADVEQPAVQAAAPVAAAPVQPESGGLQIEHHRPQMQPQAAAPAEEMPMDFEIERSASPAMSRPIPQRSEPAEAATALMVDAPAAAPAAKKPAANASRDKSRRLARALVSDILIYHREARDRALADGTLVQTLGQEIKKSWELYKERVTPEVANSSNHFREALNEILADGQKIF